MSQDFTWLETKWITIFNWCRLVQFEIKSYLADVLEHLILFLIFYVLLCILLYVLIMRWSFSFQRDVASPGRVLIVTAHPDDETMFFGPTVLRFTQNSNCAVYLMCLSTGYNYGMGSTRKKELYNACKLLGIYEERIIIQRHSALPDAMDAEWPPEIVAQLILNQVEMYDIDTLITFDKHGVSRHLNHCSIYYAIAHLSTTNKLPLTCKVVRYIANLKQRRLLYKAMQAHKSQFLWFRRLFVTFSRYTLINTLQQMDRQDIELDLELDD